MHLKNLTYFFFFQKFFSPEVIHNPQLVLIVGCTGLALVKLVLVLVIKVITVIVALAFAHVAFAELLLLLDSGEDAPLQWKRPPLRAADLVLQDKQLVWSMGSAVDFRRPLVILSYSCLLATAVLISFLI